MNKQILQEELERRLRALNERLPEERGFSERVMARIRVDAVSPKVEKDYRLWRWFMKGVIGIAASVVVGMAVWHLSVGMPRVAYGVEDVPQRMLELKSLHLKGTIYPPDGSAPMPMEMFVQRPSWMRVNGRMNTTKEGTFSTDMIMTPTERIEIDAQNKRVEISPVTDVDAELQTEQFLQQETQILLGAGKDFKKVRTEQVGGVQADVYESRVEMPGDAARVEVFLNPTTGLPVRSAMYASIGGKPEELEVEFNTIEPDAAIPAGTFKYDVPTDYQVMRTKEDMVGMAGQVNDAVFGVRFAIALDKKTVLMCWRMYDSKRPGEDLKFLDEEGNRLEIRGNEGVVYHERLLRADESAEGFHWRWSLVTTETPADTWANAISMKMHVHRGTSGNDFMPVTLPENELADVVERAQRLTLPAGGTPMTLKEIEKEAGK